MGTYLPVIFPTLTFAVEFVSGFHRRERQVRYALYGQCEYRQGWLSGAEGKRVSVVAGVASK